MRLGTTSLLLLFATGCGAATAAETSSPPPTETPSGGSPSKPAPTCDAATDFETNPQHCGRCGRACDDGACTRGMCKPRLEADGSALEGTIVTDLGVVGGRAFVGLYSRNVSPLVYPLVRFDGGKPVKVLDDRGIGASNMRVETMSSDGKTLFVGAKVGGALVLKRFAADGTAEKDILVPEDGYGSPQMSADDGRLVLRGTVGPMALFAKDGKATRLPELRSATWPTLSADDVFLADRATVERVGVDGTMSTVGDVPDGVIVGLAVGKTSIFAMTRPPDGGQGQTLYRFPRVGTQRKPDLTAALPADALEAMNAATVKVPNPVAYPIEERAIEVDGRFYFTLVVQEPKGGTSARVIVEWSESRGFRSFATVLGPYAGMISSRLQASDGRLYWLEQPGVGDANGPAWRIMSAPL